MCSLSDSVLLIHDGLVFKPDGKIIREVILGSALFSVLIYYYTIAKMTVLVNILNF